MSVWLHLNINTLVEATADYVQPERACFAIPGNPRTVKLCERLDKVFNATLAKMAQAPFSKGSANKSKLRLKG